MERVLAPIMRKFNIYSKLINISGIIRIKHLSFMILVLVIIGVVFISGCVTQDAGENIDNQSGHETAVQPTQGLKIVVKDMGMPEVKYLKPTIYEIQLQNEGGSWLTIWSDPEGKSVKLIHDGAEMVLDTVTVPAGTYVGTRMNVSTIDVEVDLNRDGDTLDKDVQIVLTLEEFESLPDIYKVPDAPTEPMPPDAPTVPADSDMPAIPDKPSEPVEDKPTGEEPGEESPKPSEPEKPPEPSQPSEPEQPAEPPEPLLPYTLGYLEDGTKIVYMPNLTDERHIVTFNGYMGHLDEEMWTIDFVYDGSGGKILYDFTLDPLASKGEQISVKVSTTN